MGYYCSITQDSVLQGPLIFSEESRSANSVPILHNGVLQTEAIFQIILLNYDPKLANPYQIILMSPDSYTYVEFDREAFEKTVLTSGLHQHNTYELVYIREGTLYQRIELHRHIYPAGSFVLLNRNVRHTEEYDTAFSTVSLSLSADYFKELVAMDREQVFRIDPLWGANTNLKEFLTNELLGAGRDGKNYIDFIPLYQIDSGEDSIQDLFEKMTTIMLSPSPGAAYFFRGIICQLLNLLCRKDLFTTHPISLGTPSESRIFSQITNLIEEKNGRVSREMLIEHLRYSGSYLNRIVQTFTGMSITQYSLQHTLKRAAWLLSNTDTPVSNIISDIGFSNRHYFYDEFKKHFGMTPREYRVYHRL